MVGGYTCHFHSKPWSGERRGFVVKLLIPNGGSPPSSTSLQPQSMVSAVFNFSVNDTYFLKKTVRDESYSKQRRIGKMFHAPWCPMAKTCQTVKLPFGNRECVVPTFQKYGATAQTAR